MDKLKIRLLFIFILFFIILSPCDSQIPVNPYVDALEIHVLESKKFDKDLNIIYLKEAMYLKSVPDSICGLKVVVVEEAFLKNRTKKKQMLPLTVVNPIEWQNNEMRIYVSYYYVTRKRKHYSWSSVYGTNVQLEYDCKNRVYNYSVSE